MLNNFGSKIDVQVGPVEMIGGHFRDIKDFFDGSIQKPGEICVRHKKFLAMREQPYALA